MTFKLTYCDIQTALLGHSHLRQTRVCLRWLSESVSVWRRLALEKAKSGTTRDYAPIPQLHPPP